MQVGRGQLDGNYHLGNEGADCSKVRLYRGFRSASMVPIDGFILVMKASTSFSVTVEKWLRGLSEPGGVAGMAEGLS